MRVWPRSEISTMMGDKCGEGHIKERDVYFRAMLSRMYKTNVSKLKRFKTFNATLTYLYRDDID